MRKKRAVFLDRDGVINKVTMRNGVPAGPRKFDDFVLVEGVKDAVESFRRMGFLIIVNTNQPDIGRGLLPEEELSKMHALLRKVLPVDDIFVCPHDEADHCSCRKPRPGMLLEAARKWEIDLKKSFAIGDRWKDMEAGRAAGCRTILLDRSYNCEAPTDFRINDIGEAAAIVGEHQRASTENRDTVA